MKLLISLVAALGCAIANAQEWFPRVEQTYQGDRTLRMCVRRLGVRPAEGEACSREEKTCFFGSQVCVPDGLTWPNLKCDCTQEDNDTFGTWSCAPHQCPGDAGRATPSAPTNRPTLSPTLRPTPNPTRGHYTPFPTRNPTSNPGRPPSPVPTRSPTRNPGRTPPPTRAPVAPTPPPTPGPTPAPTSWEDWEVSNESRCGVSEIDARGNCRPTCVSNSDCDEDGQFCWAVQTNYCGSKPQPTECDAAVTPPTSGFRCGASELVARETCGTTCSSAADCNGAAGETCHQLILNLCDCSD